VGERRLGQKVVRKTVGEPRERVRRERRDDEQVGVLEVRVGVGRLRLPGERPERLGRDEALGAVTIGVTSCPARTSWRTSSQAL
jgi:hypothetical protein